MDASAANGNCPQNPEPQCRERAAAIIAKHAEHFGLTVDEALSRSRDVIIVEARRRSVREMRALGWTWEFIGAQIRRHHTTVITLINEDGRYSGIAETVRRFIAAREGYESDTQCARGENIGINPACLRAYIARLTKAGEVQGESVMTWTHQRVQRLKKLHSEGKSYSEIAKDLGVTRLAVGGKIDRLSRAGQLVRSRARRASRLSVPSSASRPPDSVEPVAVEASQPVELTRALVSRGGGEPGIALPFNGADNDEGCRWPIGDPGSEGFHFCGRGRAAGKSYCAFHRARSVRKAKAQRISAPYESTVRRIGSGVRQGGAA